jgi:hypothetical protein
MTRRLASALAALKAHLADVDAAMRKMKAAADKVKPLARS